MFYIFGKNKMQIDLKRLKSGEAFKTVISLLPLLREPEKIALLELLKKQGIVAPKQRGIVSNPLTAEQDLFLQVVIDKLGLSPGTKIAKRDFDNFQILVGVCVVNFSKATVGQKVTRNELFLFFKLVVAILVQDLRNKMIPVTLRTICNQHSRVLGTIEKAFPGYLYDPKIFCSVILKKADINM